MMRHRMLALGFVWACVLSARASEPLPAVFEKTWSAAKRNIYPASREKEFFTEAKHEELRREAASAKDLDALAVIINSFLETLRVSHTRFYTPSDLEYYFLRSLFSTHRIDRPAFSHMGAQFAAERDGYRVRAVLSGYPAEKAGLRRGDLVVEADGRPFQPVLSFKDRDREVSLQVVRGAKKFRVPVRPVFESPHLSFLKAMRDGTRVLDEKGKKIGYIHLWTGTNDEIMKDFSAAITGPLAKTDGLILDLRDGFGGAWYDYLDPFFPNRDGFFVSTSIGRDGGEEEGRPDPVAGHPFYAKPMVVLINEGVRSGKEALAYQFKKSKRGLLVGTTTAGAFVAGKGIFAKDEPGYLLFLAVAGMELDGQVIEGKGVAPDVLVPYPLVDAPNKDPQFEAALRALLGRS